MDDHEEDEDQELTAHLLLHTVKEYLEQHDGKVRQIDLVDHFRSKLTSPETKTCARQELKDILQVITAVKIENGEKYIILMKQEHDHFQSSLIARKSKRFRRSSVRQEFDHRNSYGYNCEKSHKNRMENSRAPFDNSSSSQASSRSQSVTSLEINKRLSKISIDTTDSGTFSLHSDDEDVEDDIGLRNLRTITPLEKDWFCACPSGDLEKIRKLYKESKSLLNSADFVFGYTLLHWASKLNRTDVIDFVLSHGGNLEAKSNGGTTALHVAAISGKDDAITRLVSFGANTHARDYGGRKPKDVVKSSVAEHIQQKLGKTFVEKSILNHPSNPGTLQRNNKLRRSSLAFFRQSRIFESDDLDNFKQGFHTLQRSMSLFRDRVKSPPGRKLSHMQSVDNKKGDEIKDGDKRRSRSAADSGYHGETFEMNEYSMFI